MKPTFEVDETDFEKSTRTTLEVDETDTNKNNSNYNKRNKNDSNKRVRVFSFNILGKAFICGKNML